MPRSLVRAAALFALLPSLLFCAHIAAAAPTLTVGSASGAAGTTVNIPITFNPSPASVTGLQFNLTLPAALSTGTVTPGAILNSASKQVSTNRSGATWTFVIYGINKNTISSGTIVTAQLKIAAGTAAGALSLPISNVVYTDANGNIVTPGTSTGGTVSVTSPPPVITSALAKSGTVGSALSYQITASNSPTSYGATGLPSGLAVNTATGLMSGTPTTAGTYNITLRATNSAGTGTATLVLTISSAGQPPAISSALTKSGTVGTALSYQITATNSPTSFKATPLPAGLTVNATTGLISGTPTTAGVTTVVLTATNAFGSGTANLVVTIGLKPVISSALTKTGTVGTALSYQIAATNSPTSFKATPLPAGLSVNATTGLISGTPTTAGVTTVVLTATNAFGSGTANLVVTINANLKPVITSALTSKAAQNVAYSYQITATNSPTKYGASPLPAGLSVSTTTGKISGTPTTVGVTTVTLSAINASGTGTASLIVTIGLRPVITSALTKTGTVGTALSYTITATNSPTSFGATGLPAGLGLNTATGLISGPPTASGTFNVSISAKNVYGTGTANLVITIGTKPAITSALTKTGTVGTALSYQIAATNSPTSFKATPLPAGLSVNATTGLISGTPTTAGVTTVVLTATNAFGSGTANLVVTINANLKPVITSALTSKAAQNVAYSYQITATNSPTKYGASPLPAGLSVSTTTGKISGTSTTVGVTTVTLSAVNASGTGTASLIVTIGLRPAITNTPTKTITVGIALNYQIAATNSPTKYGASPLPAGLSVSTTTGRITGTPTTVGVTNVTLSATNAFGTGSATLVLTINAAAAPGVSITPIVNNNLSAVRVYPNPWRSDRGYVSQMNFAGLTGNTTIKIFTVSGHWVKTLSTNSALATWDLTNDSGDRVASGLYLYLITSSDGEKITGKLAIIR